MNDDDDDDDDDDDNDLSRGAYWGGGGGLISGSLRYIGYYVWQFFTAKRTKVSFYG